MTLRLSTLASALGLGLALAGCDAIENVEPRQSVSPEQALESVDGFEAILVSGYDALQDQDYYGQSFMLVPDALADNARVPNESSNRYPSFVNNVTGAHLNRWGGHYGTINEMNLVLSRIDALDVEAANPQAVRDRIKGEAYFLRAINYFDLARTKGYEPGRAVDGFTQSVIIRTEPTEGVDEADFRARSTISEVYDLIRSDLTSAIGLLNGTARGSKYFASVASANALLARVELYASNWSASEAAAEAALAATSATLVEDDGSGAALQAAWLSVTHPESIFELVMNPSTDGGTTSVNGSLQSLTDPTRGGFYDVVATTSLLSVYDDDDARLALIDSATVSGEGVPYTLKYQGTTAQDVDRVPVFRVAEMYLILAEARAEQGDTGGALEALNTLRAARGLSEYNDASEEDGNASAADIVDQVYLERRRELAFEGHRFFDLKRRGLDIPKPQTGFSVLPYTNFRVLARIPFDQVSNNDLLDQNPGY